jgi:arabinofuranosyltransferase
VILGLQAWDHRWTEDDGFINFHVVQQIMAGHGPVFNTGQRVEAFTSPVWLFMLTVGHLVLPLRLEWTAVALGIACTVGGLSLAIAGATMLVRDRRPNELLVPAGAVVPLALMPVWYFATSGLEMGLVFGWEGACLWILARWARGGGKMPWWGAVVLGLGWLIRPELVLFSLLFAAVVLGAGRARETWRDRLQFLVALFALPIAYEIFRMGYYAALLPNTAVAKEAGSAQWGSGWRYLTSSLGPYWLWIPALILGVAAYAPAVRSLRRNGERRAVLVVGAFVLGAVLVAVYIVRVGGDYLHARLLLPSIFALVTPVAVVPLRRWTAWALLVIPWALWCGIALRPTEVKFGAFGTSVQHTVTLDSIGWQPGGPARAWFTGHGLFYRPGPPLPYALAPGVPDPEVASWGAGVASYSFGPNVQIIDMLGLSDPFTAHLQLVHSGLPGHEKPLPAQWLVARFIRSGTAVNPADFPPPPPIYSGHRRVQIQPLIPPTTGPAFDEQVVWARSALQCGDIHRLLQTSTQPLSFGTFFGNFGRALSQSSLRIPPDPEQAYAKFCGSGHPSGTSP